MWEGAVINYPIFTFLHHFFSYRDLLCLPNPTTSFQPFLSTSEVGCSSLPAFGSPGASPSYRSQMLLILLPFPFMCSFVLCFSLLAMWGSGLRVGLKIGIAVGFYSITARFSSWFSLSFPANFVFLTTAEHQAGNLRACCTVISAQT